MNEINRRAFLKRSTAATIVGGLTISGVKTAKALGVKEKYATLIDLSKCDGCKEYEKTKCMQACANKNSSQYPEPIENIQPYWPQKEYEDWSDKRDLTTRLTPYNWIFVQRAIVEKEGVETEVFIPRRCMHCDNPPCAGTCPFGVVEKKAEGPVLIDREFCFGGAKCRDLCPWDIPQRQAGVGIYLKIAPKFAGGGVMYKCDFCYDLIKKGKNPSCVEQCPQGAMRFGLKEDLRNEAYTRAEQIRGFVYGDKENGGTSTFYISPVSFSDLDKAIEKSKSIPGINPQVNNPNDAINNTAKSLFIAPIAGAFAAGIAVYRTMKGEEE
ncbi:Fe-S-cluster-containing dehydrogenase component [Desulfitispora alkaliphila]|uniref:4Fe-4S dicluster domain-containing protein n=1 Tax=Desulfitispora alkaliphila TaxID=622674 RepID=UPI003D211FCC